MLEKKHRKLQRTLFRFTHVLKVSTILWLVIGVMQLSGCARTTVKLGPEEAVPQDQRIDKQWGVKIESIRTIAAGRMVDFRYRIRDPDKAVPLVDRTNKPYLIEQVSGTKLGVENPAKIGPLRQTVRYGKPKEDRVYFVLFGNPGVVKPGDQVTVVIGDFRAENLIVE